MDNFFELMSTVMPLSPVTSAKVISSLYLVLSGEDWGGSFFSNWRIIDRNQKILCYSDGNENLDFLIGKSITKIIPQSETCPYDPIFVFDEYDLEIFTSYFEDEPWEFYHSGVNACFDQSTAFESDREELI